jgi:trehalose 2-sulfotransferase
MPLAYVICTSPRSGSTLLCEGLTNTRRAGAPAEFFDHREQVIAHWMRRFGLAERSGYAERIVEATSTPNGVFGAKLHWTTHPDMHRAFCEHLSRSVPDAQQRSLNELLSARFGSVRYIWLRRRNKVAQGISHFRATRSAFWQISSDSPLGHRRDAAVDFNFRAIDGTIAWAREYDRRWKQYFAYHGLTTLQLFYEDFIDAYDATIRHVLDFLGIVHADLPKAKPSLRRMADGTSSEWEQRYREMLATKLGEIQVRDG